MSHGRSRHTSPGRIPVSRCTRTIARHRRRQETAGSPRRRPSATGPTGSVSGAVGPARPAARRRSPGPGRRRPGPAPRDAAHLNTRRTRPTRRLTSVRHQPGVDHPLPDRLQGERAELGGRGVAVQLAGPARTTCLYSPPRGSGCRPAGGSAARRAARTRAAPRPRSGRRRLAGRRGRPVGGAVQLGERRRRVLGPALGRVVRAEVDVPAAAGPVGGR